MKKYTGADLADALEVQWDTLRRNAKAEGIQIGKKDVLDIQQVRAVAELYADPARNRSPETVETAAEILAAISGNKQQVIVQNNITMSTPKKEKKEKRDKPVKAGGGYSLQWLLSDWFVSISALMFYSWQVQNLAQFARIEGSPEFFGWLFALGFCLGSVLVSAHFNRPEWLGWFGFIDGTVDFILQEPWTVTGDVWTVAKAWTVALIVAIAAGILLSMYGKIIYHKLKENAK